MDLADRIADLPLVYLRTNYFSLGAPEKLKFSYNHIKKKK